MFARSVVAQQKPAVPNPGASRPAGGVDREKMWPAPTAEDWKKPVLITFQRTWADAVAVARETGKPIMICVNMDGEIASEYYAGIAYRDPDIAKLFDDVRLRDRVGVPAQPARLRRARPPRSCARASAA